MYEGDKYVNSRLNGQRLDVHSKMVQTYFFQRLLLTYAF